MNQVYGTTKNLKTIEFPKEDLNREQIISKYFSILRQCE
jgi:hypothetical protein